jgi:hypothetical protein
MLNIMNWQTLQERRLRTRLIMFHKVINENIAIPTQNVLLQSQSTTRSSWKDFYRQILCNKDSYKFSFFCNISDSLLMLWCLLHVYLAARRYTFSSECMFSFVWGSQTVQQYSNLGLIRVWYARSFIVCDCTFRFLLIKHNDLFALAAVCWMWVFHFRSLEIVTPIYFACWTDSNIWPCML